jgi:hypothetical protein
MIDLNKLKEIHELAEELNKSDGCCYVELQINTAYFAYAPDACHINAEIWFDKSEYQYRDIYIDDLIKEFQELIKQQSNKPECNHNPGTIEPDRLAKDLICIHCDEFYMRDHVISNKPNHKYKLGDTVWYEDEEGKIGSMVIEDITIDDDSVRFFNISDGGFIFEDEAYPSLEALEKATCQHESGGLVYCSNPPKNRCKKCGEFYR